MQHLTENLVEYQGHVYIRVSRRKFICRTHNTSHCDAYIVCENGIVVDQKLPHFCILEDPNIVEKEQMMDEMVHLALYSDRSFLSIYNEIIMRHVLFLNLYISFS